MEYYTISWYLQSIPFIVKNDLAYKEWFEILSETEVFYFDGWNMAKGKLGEDYFNNLLDAINKLNNVVLLNINNLDKNVEKLNNELFKINSKINSIVLQDNNFLNEMHKLKDRENFIYFISSDLFGEPYIKQTNLFKVEIIDDIIRGYEDVDGFYNWYGRDLVSATKNDAIQLLLNNLIEKQLKLVSSIVNEIKSVNEIKYSFLILEHFLKNNDYNICTNYREIINFK